MPLPRFIEIDGHRYLWRDLIDARRAQTTPKVPQPALFELRKDHRPAGERTAAERYREPQPVHRARYAGAAVIAEP